jgi:hypothetical protein
MEIISYSEIINGDKRLEKLNKTQRAQLEKKAKRLSYGELYTTVMECKGIDKCPYGKRCPYYLDDESLLPIGEDCLLEAKNSAEWFEQYIDEYNVDRYKRSEIQLVINLVSIDVEISRAKAQMAREGMEQLEVTETEKGKTFSKKLHNLDRYVSERYVQRSKVIDLLDKKKSGGSGVKDPSEYIKEIMARKGGN